MTPTEQALTIQQYPSPAILEQPVLLVVNGVDPTTIQYFNWFQDRVPNTERQIIGYVKGRTPLTQEGPLTIGTVQAEQNGTLRILSFARSNVNIYTIQLQAATLETASIILVGEYEEL